MELEDRVALVTGAAGGIGRATAIALAGAGATVVTSDIADEPGRETVEAIRASGGIATYVHADVSDEEEVDALLAHVEGAHGRLDCAVNAAGVEFEATLLHEAASDDYRRMFAVNVQSVFLCMRRELELMLAGGRPGSIVNVASTNASRPQPGTPLYTASKHAVLGMVRATALDYAARGIRVNAISPGAIDTSMLRGAIGRRGGNPDAFAKVLSPMRRFGQPEEVARAALWLCSDASSFTTGANLSVDGGFLAS